MASTPNDTDGARVINGVKEEDGYVVTGSRTRLELKAGNITYDKAAMTPEQRDYGRGKKYDGGVSRGQALLLGLPEKVRGNPLGCGCGEANLVGATQPVGSHIEADYMCDSGWHNYLLFELIGFEQKPETQLKIDASGNLVEDVDEETKELGDY